MKQFDTGVYIKPLHPYHLSQRNKVLINDKTSLTYPRAGLSSTVQAETFTKHRILKQSSVVQQEINFYRYLGRLTFNFILAMKHLWNSESNLKRMI